MKLLRKRRVKNGGILKGEKEQKKQKGRRKDGLLLVCLSYCSFVRFLKPPVC